MINRFGILYAGNVDFEDLGYDATPVNERYYDNERIAGCYQTTERLAQHVDSLGYDVLWLAEHHFQPEGYELFPNIPLLAVHLAHFTKNIRFGSAFNIGPMWNPLRLAEDFALADILTGGRVIFGLGRGYHSREVETLGAPLIDQARNRAIFEETLEIIHRAFTEQSFSFHGDHFTVPPPVPYRGYELEHITLTPRPTHDVEWWLPIVSGSPGSLEPMFRYGCKGLLSGGLSDAAAGRIAAYNRVAEGHGQYFDSGTNLRLQVVFHMADTVDRALHEAEPWWEENVKMFAPLNFIQEMNEEQIVLSAQRSGLRTSQAPTLRDQWDERAVYVGPPEGFVAYLREIEERYPGLESMNVNHAFAAPSAVMFEQLSWFSAEVMPHFARDRVPASTE